MKNYNHIDLVGCAASDLVFSYSIYGENFYKFNIAVNRLSENIDILPVTVPGRVLKDSEVAQGKIIQVEGQIRSHYSLTNGGDHPKLLLTVYALKLKLPENVTATNVNNLALSGVIKKEPIWRTTPLGRAITEISLVVNRSVYKRTDSIPCISWGKTAQVLKEMKVGDNVSISGRFQSRQYDKRDANGEVTEKTAYEVSINAVTKE